MIIDCAVYEGGERVAGELALDDAFEAATRNDGFVWLDMIEPSTEEFERVRREFDLHELAVEDALSAHQRPKLEEYGDTLFVVIKTARYVDPNEVVEFGEVRLFVARSFVIAVRQGRAGDLADIRARAEERPDLLRHGPGAVLYAIIDQIVDEYAPVVVGVDEDIQQVETDVFSPDRNASVQRIYLLKREVLQFHMAISSLTEPLEHLARGPIGPLPEGLGHYFRDVRDHLLRVIARVDAQRDLLTNILAANLTLVSLQQNQDMRKISAWVAIAAVPTAVAGIYGMNFTYMPELDWIFGYPLILSAIAIACLLIYRRFKRIGWL